MKVTIPVNTTATIHLSAAKEAGVMESGKPVRGAEGVSGVRTDAGAVIVEVGSGTYAFTMPHP